MKKTTHFRVVTPKSFSDIDSIDVNGVVKKILSNKEEAQTALDNFGTTDESSEYFKYWQKVRKQCKIVKVTTIIEEV